MTPKLLWGSLWGTLKIPLPKPNNPAVVRKQTRGINPAVVRKQTRGILKS
jgi:hypothetical protein